MSQESNISVTVKVNGDLVTFRGDTVEEFVQNAMQGEVVIDWTKRLQSLAGGSASNHTTPTVSAPQNAAVPQQTAPQPVVSDAPSTGAIEEQTDRFGNRFQRGVPGTGFCAHGPRVVKHGISKAGKKYKAHACVNDSPFGDYKQGKCDMEFPN